MTSTHTHSSSTKTDRLVYVCIITGAFLIIEIVGGYLSGSLALLADAGHMFTDLGGLLLAIFAIKIGAKPATSQRTYGFHRAEILAALVNALVLIGISFFVLYEAYERFKNPQPIASGMMILVALCGLIINIFGMWLLAGRGDESLNMKGAYFELLSDALSSVGVLLAASVVWATGWYVADPIVSAAIGLFILPRTWSLLNEAVGILLEGVPSNINITWVREQICNVSGVESVHDLHVWSISTGRNAISAHVVASLPDVSNQLLGQIHRSISGKFQIEHITIQLECPGFDEFETHL